MKVYLNILAVLHIFTHFLLGDSFARAQSTIVVNKSFQESNGSESLMVLEDRTRDATVDEVRAVIGTERWRPMGLNSSFGFTKSAIWLHSVLENPSEEHQKVFVSFLYPVIDTVEFWQLDQNKEKTRYGRGGDLKNTKINLVEGPKPTFLMTIPPGRSYILIRGETKGSMMMSLSVQSEATYYQNKLKDTVIVTLLVGILIVMALYNFFIFLQLRKPLYLYYVCFVLSMSFQPLVYTGFITYLTDDHTFTMNTLNSIAIVFGNYAATLFAYTFLSLKKYQPRLSILFHFNSFFLVSALIAALIDREFGIRLIMIFTASTVLLLILWGFNGSIKGYRPAYFFTLAWLGVLLGAIIRTVSLVGFIPPSDIVEYSTLLGSVAEAILISIALSEKVRDSEKRAYEKIENLNKELGKSNRTMTHAFRQLSKIVYPHQIQKIKNGGRLEDTMPIHEGEGCVVCLDIIGSSKMHPETSKVFLRRMFRRCYEEMIKDYNGNQLIANAFRVKEMGDGFLCSIDYPFHSPSENPAQLALMIARRFYEIVADESLRLQSNESVNCSIGVAHGAIQGFYPESGTKEYDLFGEALVLATRYQGLRKSGFPVETDTSYIFIQEKVGDMAQIKEEENLEVIEFARYKIRIPEDPTATKVYVQTISHHGKPKKTDLAG
ncbi:MAG: hypothetical protein HRU19_20565 [Pseudobacteriovorax sp.]|nr:hypothetical protein [Pseudobacteriovorax sp.]